MEKIPNILSTFRILLAPLFLFLYLQDIFFWRMLSLVIFFVAALTDFFDGYLARKFDVKSKFGAFLDPLADKILTFTGFICLPYLSADQFPWWAIILIIARDIIITLMRILASSRGLEMKTRVTAKTKTAIQMVFLYISLTFGVLLLLGGKIGHWTDTLLASGVFYWGLITVVAVTLYSGFEYLLLNRNLFVKRSSE
ncbi:MAG: CDP-diacylglycerol--glycerol-3-phosphate 3-phosphatidyltransferase [Bacteroidetes bacterium]|nr:CDP-diacylglycerol--glycerol-3-phosphate 3-phosphatidyltransferase [Bacteroidota bacterium]